MCPDLHEVLVVREEARALAHVHAGTLVLATIGIHVEVPLVEIHLDGRQPHGDHILVFGQQELGES